MVQNQEQPVGRITFSILIALSLSHCLNDLLQSVISAAYPLFKDDLGLNFAQIGLITLVYQLSASVFQQQSIHLQNLQLHGAYFFLSHFRLISQ